MRSFASPRGLPLDNPAYGASDRLDVVFPDSLAESLLRSTTHLRHRMRNKEQRHETEGHMYEEDDNDHRSLCKCGHYDDEHDDDPPHPCLGVVGRELCTCLGVRPSKRRR